MPSGLDFLAMMVRQQTSIQVLDRTSEPDSITDAAENVAQYDQVMETKLVLAYAAGLTIAHRAQSVREPTRAVDVACGPGHFTLCLGRYLGCESITGVDLSAPMVEVATQNAAKLSLNNSARFQTGDATDLGTIEDEVSDLTTFTDAAHHMPNLDTVRAVMYEMARITKPEGLVMLMDLVRLRTEALTERYVNVLGHDYIERGLPAFFEDFRNSMYAAWTAKELREAIPRDTDRWWCHIVPRGLPTIQVILGLPVGRKRPFVRRGVPWSRENHPVPPEMRGDWRMMRATLALASKTFIPPKR